MRLIDADHLKEWLTSSGGFGARCDGCTDVECVECIVNEAIDNAPTVNARLVVHGKWVKKIEEVSSPTCTMCGKSALLATNRIYAYSRYCPNCGAKMDLR